MKNKRKFTLSDLIQGKLDGITKEEAKHISDAIDAGSKAYQEDVLKMSDKELYHHVFDEEYDPNDFASKELERRGVDKDGNYPCYACQGGGCPTCGGFGTLSILV